MFFSSDIFDWMPFVILGFILLVFVLIIFFIRRQAVEPQ